MASAPITHRFAPYRPPIKRPRHCYSSSSSQRVPQLPTLSEACPELTDQQMLIHRGYCGRERKIGSGRYCKVLLAQHAVSGTKVAVKVVDMKKVSKEFLNKFLPRELNIWSRLNHPNLVRMCDYFQGNSKVYMVLEYVPCGDLLTFVQKQGPLSSCWARVWLLQLVAAVCYLHVRGVAHRDLKLENILIDQDKQLKITDFGFSSHKESYELSQTFCGSKSYSAPEILSGQPYDPFKADVWSLGVVAFVLVTNRMPFNERVAHNSIIVNAQKQRLYHFPKHLLVSPLCQQLVDDMLTFDWRERPSIKDVSLSDWLQQYGADGDHLVPLPPPPPQFA